MQSSMDMLSGQPKLDRLLLQDLPSLDPSLMFADGHGEDAPTSGILMTFWIDPLALSVAADVTTYPEGGLSWGEVYDERQYTHGKVMQSYTTLNASIHRVIYETPFAAARNWSDEAGVPVNTRGMGRNNVDVIDLSTGDRLIVQRAPFREDMRTSLEWNDPVISSGGMMGIRVNRITGDAHTAQQILAQVGLAMGMSPEAQEAFVLAASRDIAPSVAE